MVSSSHFQNEWKVAPAVGIDTIVIQSDEALQKEIEMKNDKYVISRNCKEMERLLRLYNISTTSVKKRAYKGLKELKTDSDVEYVIVLQTDPLSNAIDILRKFKDLIESVTEPYTVR